MTDTPRHPPASPNPDLEDRVRHALAQAAGVNADQVPEPLVHATVHARGDRSAVATATRQLTGGAEPPFELVLFDTDRIGDWVFESSRPPVLEGASAILDGLNRSIGEDFPHAVVFSGGGEGLLLLPRGRGAEAVAELERRYADETRGALTVTSTVLAAAPEDFVPAADEEPTADAGARRVAGTAAVLARLRDRVRRVKDQRLPPRSPVAGHRDRCVSCRDRAGTVDLRRFRQEETGFLCDPCNRRWEVGKGRIAGDSFDDLVDRFSERLGDREGAARSRYLGFLYADGNALGRVFGRLGSLAELAFASDAVRGVFAGLRRRARQRTATLLGVDADARLPLLSLLAGGDEMILIAPAALTVDLAARLPGWLDAEVDGTEGLDELLQHHGLARLSVGMGLVAAPLGYPVRYQYALARQLQSNAKGLFYGAGGAEPISCVDFEVMTDGNPLAEELVSARRATYGTEEEGFLRTCRPYRAETFTELVGLVRGARARGVATSQLRNLEAGAEEGRHVFMNYLLYQLARGVVSEAYSKWLADFGVALEERKQIEDFFVRSSAALGPEVEATGTWVTDALHLAPFIDLVDRLEESRHAAA